MLSFKWGLRSGRKPNEKMVELHPLQIYLLSLRKYARPCKAPIFQREYNSEMEIMNSLIKYQNWIIFKRTFFSYFYFSTTVLSAIGFNFIFSFNDFFLLIYILSLSLPYYDLGIQMSLLISLHKGRYWSKLFTFRHPLIEALIDLYLLTGLQWHVLLRKLIDLHRFTSTLIQLTIDNQIVWMTSKQTNRIPEVSGIDINDC